MRRLTSLATLAAALSTGLPAAAQTPPNESQQAITRADAVASALLRGPLLAIARADSAAAFAQWLTAGALDNPGLSLSYSKSAPRYHVGLDLPLDLPWVRRDRIGAAEQQRRGAQYRFAFARAATALAADTTYTVALAAAARARLAQRNAADADSLWRIARTRREAGDASDLDVRLAEVYAGQQLNLAAADSLALASALLDVQGVMGLAREDVRIALTDSLGPPPDSDASAPPPEGPAVAAAIPLRVAAASNALAAAEIGVRLQRRALYGIPSLSAGFETRDPGGSERGVLPTIGFTLPLPLLNRNRGGIAAAQADRDRATAELTLARIESATEIARLQRTRLTALQKVWRDQALLASAERVAAMALTAYREGAAALPNVLEARRSAREIMSQTIDDLALAWIASATLRVMSLTTVPDARSSR